MLRTAQFYGKFHRKSFQDVNFDQDLERNIARWLYLEARKQSSNAIQISFIFNGITMIVVIFLKNKFIFIILCSVISIEKPRYTKLCSLHLDN